MSKPRLLADERKYDFIEENETLKKLCGDNYDFVGLLKNLVTNGKIRCEDLGETAKYEAVLKGFLGEQRRTLTELENELISVVAFNHPFMLTELDFVRITLTHPQPPSPRQVVNMHSEERREVLVGILLWEMALYILERHCNKGTGR